MSDMRQPRVEKVVVNIGVGEAGERLAKAHQVVEMITGQKAVDTISRTISRDLAIRKGMPLGCKVTLRGERAEDFLRRALAIRDNRIQEYSFDPEGNMSFGVGDYTDFPGMRYDPDIGIFGMDVNAVLRRPGSRISTRMLRRRRIPRSHRLERDEALEFWKANFNVEVVE